MPQLVDVLKRAYVPATSLISAHHEFVMIAEGSDVLLYLVVIREGVAAREERRHHKEAHLVVVANLMVMVMASIVARWRSGRARRGSNGYQRV